MFAGQLELLFSLSEYSSTKSNESSLCRKLLKKPHSSNEEHGYSLNFQTEN